jgi:hypothetical protein
MDSDWEDKFLMVSVRALERIESLSDLAPILMTTGSARPRCARHFKFELGWLHRDGFHDMVKSIWERPVVGHSPTERWNNKICSVRKHLGG